MLPPAKPSFLLLWNFLSTADLNVAHYNSMYNPREENSSYVCPSCVCLRVGVCLWFWYTYQNLWFVYGLCKPVSPDYINYWFSIRHSTQMTFVIQYWFFQTCLCEALKIHLWGLLVQFNSAALIFFSYLFLFGMSSKPGLLKKRITYTHRKKQFFNTAFLYTG